MWYMCDVFAGMSGWNNPRLSIMIGTPLMVCRITHRLCDSIGVWTNVQNVAEPYTALKAVKKYIAWSAPGISLPGDGPNGLRSKGGLPFELLER